MLLELAYDVCDRGGFLADRHVYAKEVLAFLVDDRVDRNRGLAGLAVADDELALAATYGNHGIDGLKASLNRLRHRLTCDHAGGDLLDDIGHLGVDRPLAVDGLAQRVHHAPEKLRTDRHGKDLAGAFDRI